ncbi:unnamed protein product [Ostreobium quekettii]|uniref:Uncharacterized protein n=1 Tax=Ostreobium quekettii TaxID=121088 RepID=A0A8S1ITU0_9CHLO|nr:unnamed protein product [Ostreobium quekettii]
MALKDMGGKVGVDYKVMFRSASGPTDTSPTGDYSIDKFLLGINIQNDSSLSQYEPDEISLGRMQFFANVRPEEVFDAQPVSQKDSRNMVLWKVHVALAGALSVIALGAIFLLRNVVAFDKAIADKLVTTHQK